MSEENAISEDTFNKCILEIEQVSDQLIDGWKVQKCDNGCYLTKKAIATLHRSDSDEGKSEEENQSMTIVATFDYHIVYSKSYSVPMLCFNVWRQDGSLLTMEDYWTYNKSLKDSNMFDTLTQLDHPVLCRPFLTLHPCKTADVMEPFLTTSKNPVVSWLSVVAPFVHLNLLEDYFKIC